MFSLRYGLLLNNIYASSSYRELVYYLTSFFLLRSINLPFTVLCVHVLHRKERNSLFRVKFTSVKQGFIWFYICDKVAT